MGTMAGANERVVILNSSETSKYAGNQVSTTKYTVLTFLPKNLFEQFHRMANIYFLFIVILNWIPAINSFDKEISILPLLLVLSTTAIKDLYEDWQRHLSDKRVNNLSCRIFSPAKGVFEVKRWREVVVGDLVQLEDGEQVPADLLLLQTSNSSGKCNVETQNLDGETNLKSKYAVSGVPMAEPFPSEVFHCVLTCDAPTSQVDAFHGSLRLNDGQVAKANVENLLLRGCVLKNTSSIVGLVVFAGRDTKAMLNSLGPRFKRSKMEGRVNKDLLWCWIFLFVLCLTGAVGCGIWNASFISSKAPFLAVLSSDDINPLTEGFLTFWTFVIILQIIIPISLYITIEMVKVAQVYLIHSDPLMWEKKSGERAKCKSFNIAEDLGQVEHVLCDKTGTLTENKMIFKACSVLGRDFRHEYVFEGNEELLPNNDLKAELKSELESEELPSLLERPVFTFLLSLAVANTVNVSTIQERVSSWADLEQAPSIKYEAESGDELALVQAAAAYGVTLVARSQKEVGVKVADYELFFNLLHTLPFDSTRRRMSVLVREPKSGHTLLLCKGADCSVIPRASVASQEDGFVEATTAQIREYSRTGLRGLVMAARTVNEMEYHQWREQLLAAENSIESKDALLRECYDMLEKDLRILGGTGVEDRLQPMVPSTLTNMRAAGLAIWLLTGDSRQTAESVATSCNLITHETKVVALNFEELVENSLTLHLEELCIEIEQDLSRLCGRKYALVVEGHNLHLALSTNADLFLKLASQCDFVLACRVTPLQKGILAKMVREKLGVLTMAIGDGANDVSMLQTSNIGVAILGQEGRQAAMASDFAVPRFELVGRLVLVHGHWSYIRLASLVLNSFYKNAAFVLTMFWFQLYCGFSGEEFIDQLYLVLFSVLFTSVPPLALGIFDRDFSHHELTSNPSLYSIGRLSTTYTSATFWLAILEAVYHSLAVFYIAYGATSGSEMGLWEFGTLVNSQCILVVLIQVSVEFRSWTVLHLLSILSSVAMYLVIGLFYSTVSLGPAHMIMHRCLTSPMQWTILGLTAIAASLPRMTVKAVGNTLGWQNIRR